MAFVRWFGKPVQAELNKRGIDMSAAMSAIGVPASKEEYKKVSLTDPRLVQYLNQRGVDVSNLVRDFAPAAAPQTLASVLSAPSQPAAPAAPAPAPARLPSVRTTPPAPAPAPVPIPATQPAVTRSPSEHKGWSYEVRQGKGSWVHDATGTRVTDPTKLKAEVARLASDPRTVAAPRAAPSAPVASAAPSPAPAPSASARLVGSPAHTQLNQQGVDVSTLLDKLGLGDQAALNDPALTPYLGAGGLSAYQSLLTPPPAAPAPASAVESAPVAAPASPYQKTNMTNDDGRPLWYDQTTGNYTDLDPNAGADPNAIFYQTQQAQGYGGENPSGLDLFTLMGQGGTPGASQNVAPTLANVFQGPADHFQHLQSQYPNPGQVNWQEAAQRIYNEMGIGGLAQAMNSGFMAQFHGYQQEGGNEILGPFVAQGQAQQDGGHDNLLDFIKTAALMYAGANYVGPAASELGAAAGGGVTGGAVAGAAAGGTLGAGTAALQGDNILEGGLHGALLGGATGAAGAGLFGSQLAAATPDLALQGAEGVNVVGGSGYAGNTASLGAQQAANAGQFAHAAAPIGLQSLLSGTPQTFDPSTGAGVWDQAEADRLNAARLTSPQPSFGDAWSNTFAQGGNTMTDVPLVGPDSLAQYEAAVNAEYGTSPFQADQTLATVLTPPSGNAMPQAIPEVDPTFGGTLTQTGPGSYENVGNISEFGSLAPASEIVPTNGDVPGPNGNGGNGEPSGGGSGVPGSGSPLSNLTGLDPNLLQLLGIAGATGLGIYGANQQADALKDIASKEDARIREMMGFGAPSRARYEASFAPGFKLADMPGFTEALDTSYQGLLRGLSTGGNPYGNPGGLMEAQKWVTGNVALPALKNYRDINAGAGGLTQYAGGAASGPNLSPSMGAVNAQGSAYDALGYGLGQITQPRRRTLSDLLSLT